MLLFAVAHAVQLEDGSYAIRSSEFPGCEARNARVELARDQFGDALRERSLEMIEAGEVPPLYTYEELGPSFADRCIVQIPAPDRMPGTFDRVIAVRVKLPPEAAERLRTIRVAPQRELRTSEPQPIPIGKTDPALRDTSAADDETRGRLDPSARLALVAARLAGRDRHVG
jgi:DNA-binding TFAR19-related protein (PDSD5 family)